MKKQKKIIQLIYYLNLIHVKKQIQWKKKEKYKYELKKYEYHEI